MHHTISTLNAGGISGNTTINSGGISGTKNISKNLGESSTKDSGIGPQEQDELNGLCFEERKR